MPVDNLINSIEDEIKGTDIILTDRFESALVFAYRLHAQQTRKFNQIPFFAHLMSVASLVLEYGGNEDEAIAALLHDAVEDQGGEPILRKIRTRFGDSVTYIVANCSDSIEYPKKPWKERKDKYFEHLNTQNEGIRRVILADKLHNCRSLITTYRREGEKTWKRFRGGKEGTLWYYQMLVDAFNKTSNDELTEEFIRTFEVLCRLIECD